MIANKPDLITTCASQDRAISSIEVPDHCKEKDHVVEVSCVKFALDEDDHRRDDGGGDDRLRRSSSERNSHHRESGDRQQHHPHGRSIRRSHTQRQIHPDHHHHQSMRQHRLQVTDHRSFRESKSLPTSPLVLDERRPSWQTPKELVSRQVSSESTRAAAAANMNTTMTTVSSSRPAFTDSSATDLLTYTKYFLIAAFFVFMFGAGITMNELVAFLAKSQHTSVISAIILSVLGLISLIGLYGALKEDSCILMTYGAIIIVVFVGHVIMLFVLKNLCSETQRKCYRNMATPPGLAPILVAISELVIGMCAFFMALVIESEKQDGKKDHSKSQDIQLNRRRMSQPQRRSLIPEP